MEHGLKCSPISRWETEEAATHALHAFLSAWPSGKTGGFIEDPSSARATHRRVNAPPARVDPYDPWEPRACGGSASHRCVPRLWQRFGRWWVGFTVELRPTVRALTLYMGLILQGPNICIFMQATTRLLLLLCGYYRHIKDSSSPLALHALFATIPQNADWENPH